MSEATTIRAYGAMADVPREGWGALAADAMPFMEWEWLNLLETSGSAASDAGWIPRHVVVYQGERMVAAAPAYLKLNSMGEFVYDWSWANAARQVGVRYYPKLISAVPFTPATGRRLLIAPDQDRVARIQELVGAMHTLADQVDASGVNVLFCTGDEADELGRLGGEVRIQHQYHWKNAGYRDFDDFLSRFRTKRRKEIRRERRGAAEGGLSLRAVEGDDLTPALLQRFHRHYRNTCDRYGGWDYLQPAVWRELPRVWPGRVVLFAAFEGERLRAGAFCVRKGDRLYGRYWGHDPSWEPPKHLHFELCFYAPIQYAIERGVRLFEPGQGGHHKFSRGFEPSICYSAHWIFDEKLRGPLASFLVRERAAVRQRVQDMLLESPIRPKDEG